MFLLFRFATENKKVGRGRLKNLHPAAEDEPLPTTSTSLQPGEGFSLPAGLSAASDSCSRGEDRHTTMFVPPLGGEYARKFPLAKD